MFLGPTADAQTLGRKTDARAFVVGNMTSWDLRREDLPNQVPSRPMGLPTGWNMLQISL